VVGVDTNEDLLRAAEAKRLANAEFRKADLRRRVRTVRDEFLGCLGSAIQRSVARVVCAIGRR